MKKKLDKALNQALKFLERRDHFSFEIEQKLRQKGFSDEEISTTIEKLRSYGYLNDEKFCENFVESIRQKPIGKKLIKNKLLQKNISEEIITKILDTIEEEELVKTAIKKRIQQKGLPKDLKDLEKLYKYLIRQGFQSETVVDALREIGFDTEIDFEGC